MRWVSGAVRRGDLQFVPEAKVVVGGIVIDGFVRGKDFDALAVLAGALAFDFSCESFHAAKRRAGSLNETGGAARWHCRP